MKPKRKVFVSFRFEDGNSIKKKLINFLENKDLIINKSEDVDRSQMSEEIIQKYLFEKLKDTSITLVLLTPKAISYIRNSNGDIDDWLYDELRYSLYNRDGNHINGVIALYTPQAGSIIIKDDFHFCEICGKQSTIKVVDQFDNLVRDNMMNIKEKFKIYKCDNVYDSDFDSYISLISLEEFYNKPDKYIEIAFQKRSDSDNYTIHVKKD